MIKEIMIGVNLALIARLTHIISPVSQPITPITEKYLKVFSNFDQCSFSNISFKSFIMCFKIYLTHEMCLKYCSFTPIWIIFKLDYAVTLTLKKL